MTAFHNDILRYNHVMFFFLFFLQSLITFSLVSPSTALGSSPKSAAPLLLLLLNFRRLHDLLLYNSFISITRRKTWRKQKKTPRNGRKSDSFRLFSVFCANRVRADPVSQMNLLYTTTFALLGQKKTHLARADREGVVGLTV